MVTGVRRTEGPGLRGFDPSCLGVPAPSLRNLGLRIGGNVDSSNPPPSDFARVGLKPRNRIQPSSRGGEFDLKSTNSERSHARTRFQKLALGLALVCFILVGMIVLIDNTPIRDRLLIGALCLLLVIPTIAGIWSPRPKR